MLVSDLTRTLLRVDQCCLCILVVLFDSDEEDALEREQRVRLSVLVEDGIRLLEQQRIEFLESRALAVRRQGGEERRQGGALGPLEHWMVARRRRDQLLILGLKQVKSGGWGRNGESKQKPA